MGITLSNYAQQAFVNKMSIVTAVCVGSEKTQCRLIDILKHDIPSKFCLKTIF